MSKENFTSHPIIQDQKLNDILNKLIHPEGIVPPAISALPTTGNLLEGIASSAVLGIAPGDTEKTKALVKSIGDDWYSQTADAAQKVRDNYQKTFDDLKRMELEFANDPVMLRAMETALGQLSQVEQKQLADLKDTTEKFKSETSSLFDDLVSGNAKGFAKALQKDLENIVLQPIKKVFETKVGGIFAGLDSAINKPAGAPGATSTTSGGFFARLLGGFNLGGTSIATPPFFGGSIPGIGGVSVTGQKQFSTQTMMVTAGTVNIGGGPGGGGTTSTTGGAALSIPGVGAISLPTSLISGSGISSAISQFGSFFGNNNPVGASLPLNLIQYGGVPGLSPGGATFGSTGSTGSFFGNLSPFLGGGMLVGAGLASHSLPGVTTGITSLASSGFGTLAKALGISSGTAAGVTGALGGAGMLATGLEQGGVSGGFSDLLGGAGIGASIGSIVPGIGTAAGAVVGAIAGGVTGIIRGLFSGETFAQRVSEYVNKHNYLAPPAETFQFASNGSIGSTLATGFAQNGNSFSQFALPSGTPFTAKAFTGQLTGAELALLQQQSQIGSSQPFLGFPSTDPTGRIQTGQNAWSTPATQVPTLNLHFNLPGYVSADSAVAALAPAMDHITNTVVSKFRQSSYGMGAMVRSLATLP